MRYFHHCSKDGLPCKVGLQIVQGVVRPGPGRCGVLQYGAQGGGAKDVAPAFDKNGRGAVINSSRGIMCAYKKGDYAETDYAKAAREEAIRMRDEINSVL